MNKIQLIIRAKEDREIKRLVALSAEDFTAHIAAVIIEKEAEIDAEKDKLFGFRLDKPIGTAVYTALQANKIAPEFAEKLRQYKNVKAKQNTLASPQADTWTVETNDPAIILAIEKDAEKIVVYMRPTDDEKAKRKAAIRATLEA